MEFTLFWLKGKSELVYGDEISLAIQSTTKKGKVVYYTDGNSLSDYEFDRENKNWFPKPNVKFNLDFFPLEMNNEGKDNDGNTIRSFFIDDTGKNKIMVKQNDKLITLILKLGKTKSRLIGTVTKSTRTIEMIRNQSRGHLFWSTNSYGFGYYVLKNQTSIDWIRLSDDMGGHWKIPVHYLLKAGKFLHFKNQGFELQILLSLEELNKQKDGRYIFRVDNNENRRF